MSTPVGDTGQPLTRAAWLRILTGFALKRGRSLCDKTRLFYYAGLKHSLVFRDWACFNNNRILKFNVRGFDRHQLCVFARDNGLDVTTFEEFFSSRFHILPPELPPYSPHVIYDIGANIGIASLYFAGRYPAARCFAFEPVPDNVEICRLNFDNLRDSRVFHLAVGSQSGAATFFYDNHDLRGGSLQRLDRIESAARKKQIEVRVVTVAELVNDMRLPPPDFIKIDVEGAELAVLEGATGAIATVRRMLIETHGEELAINCMKWALANGFYIPHVHSVSGGFASIWCDRI
jgi:FkbM family methyltransferase